jgi:hypothetical protein
MYTLGLYAICIGLVLLAGAGLFAALAALAIIRHGCRFLVTTAAAALVRLRSVAMKEGSTRLVPHYALPSRNEWNETPVGGEASQGDGLEMR